MLLIDYLRENFNQYSKNNIKNLLKNGCVRVNEKIVTNANYILNDSDEVVVIPKFIKYLKTNIFILYEDKDLIIVDKPVKMLTIATTKEKDKTLYNIVSTYLKKQNKNSKIFIVHRLDKETSGIVVFAKNEKVKNILQANWNACVYREYRAWVHKKIKGKKTLKNYIQENQYLKSFVTDKNKGKLAITEYEVLKNEEDKTLLKIVIKTGRKNQIRVQLAHINHPILGDKKYGLKDNEKRLMLHAYKIKFLHPITNKKIEIKTPLPF